MADICQTPASDKNEAKSKKDDDPDRHYWEGCASPNTDRAVDLRTALGDT